MRPNVTKNASALMVTKSEKGNQFILVVFSKAVVFRKKKPLIALQVQFACQFGLIDIILHLHLRSPLGFSL